MLLNDCKTLVIEGIKTDGGKFRPSDWIERISTALATIDKNRKIHYASDAHPAAINGEKCLVVSSSLQNRDPAAFEYIMDFAHKNDLKITGQECALPEHVDIAVNQ